MNPAASRALPREPFRGRGFHAIRLRHAVVDPIGTAYSIDIASRYSPGAFAAVQQYETLYLADDPVSALQEVEALALLGGRLVHSWVDAWCVVPCAFSKRRQL